MYMIWHVSQVNSKDITTHRADATTVRRAYKEHGQSEAPPVPGQRGGFLPPISRAEGGQLQAPVGRALARCLWRGQIPV